MSITDIRQAVLTGDADGAADLARAELEAGTAPAVIMNEALISAMDEAGARMATGELFIPEVLVASEAMRAAMDVITPHLEVEAAGGRGTVVIGAVEGDVHDIGKSLVALMLDGAGFTVHDLGVDVAIPDFVAAAKEHDADVVAMSSLMVTTMPKMKVVIEALHAAGLEAKPIVGGAPITQAFADEIGAAGYAPDAGGAVRLVRDLL
ncbi:MAG TPA: cobalamin-dependent protein [Thermoleophilia bacterium]|nr:cobalamin-dependent protein [Thermoleophilia bacterium]